MESIAEKRFSRVICLKTHSAFMENISHNYGLNAILKLIAVRFFSDTILILVSSVLYICLLFYLYISA